MSRQLVVTADDLGVDPATIEALAELVPAGRVSAASVIPMAPWAGLAVDRLKGYTRQGGSGRLSLGLHANFTAEVGGGSWGPRTAGPSLVRPGTGTFHSDVAAFAAAADANEVFDEMLAQVAWFEATGVRPTHLDSHHGAIYGIDGPHFLHIAVQVCAAHGLALRLPRVVPDELGALRPNVRLVHRAAVALADDLEVQLPQTLVTDWRPQRAISGYLDLRDAYLRKIRDLPQGRSEMFLHPAAVTTGQAPERADQVKRQWELRLLQDDAFAQALTVEGVEVVTWRPDPVPVPAQA